MMATFVNYGFENLKSYMCSAVISTSHIAGCRIYILIVQRDECSVFQVKDPCVYV
jgi:hypothetical protein